MKNRKAVHSKPKKAAPRKSTLAKLAVKALKLVSGRKSKAAGKPANKTKSKPVRSKVAMSSQKSKARRSGPIQVNGRQLTEADIRRMPETGYMNDIQLDFFRQRLLQMRNEVIEREVDVKERLHQRESFADPADRATAEEEHWLDLRLRERESLLLRKIDEALHRIREREYGFCEVTGEEIGIPRLLARPTATVCVDVKGQNEQIESQFRDR